jgi:long-subunit fatty acid transport protein
VGQERQIAVIYDPGNNGVATCSGAREEPSCDIGFKAEVNDKAAFTWNAGLLVEPPSKKWAVGFMYQPKIKFDPTGYLEADLSGNFLRETGFINVDNTRDDNVSMLFEMPTIVKTGFLYRPKDTFEIELAGVFEGWGSFPGTRNADGDLKLIITDVNLNIETCMPGQPDCQITEVTEDIELDAGLTNSYSLRLGWEWDVSEAFTIRNGYFYETTGLPGEIMNVGLVDRNKFGYGIGGSWAPNQQWIIDAGLFQSFLGSWTIDNSESAQVALELSYDDVQSPPQTSVVDGRTVSDGEYSSSALIFGLGASYRFGAKKK